MDAAIEQLRARARERFPEDQFVARPGIAVWQEHVAPARKVTLPDGTSTEIPAFKFDREALEMVAASCNRRITNTGDYAALSSGHPTADGEVSGWLGPFWVDRFGADEPRWGIFADEWQYRDEAARLQRRPRRSVELRRVGSPDQWYLDPIAALGVETPRFPLGHVGVDCYSLVMAPMAPSATNTFIPAGVGPEKRPDEKETYGMDAMNPELKDQIKALMLEAMAESPDLKFAREMRMKAEQEAGETSEVAQEDATESPVEASATEGGETEVSGGTDADASTAETETEATVGESAESAEATEEEDETKRSPSMVVTEHYSLDKPHSDPFIEKLRKEIYSLRQDAEQRNNRDRLRDRELSLDKLFASKHFTDEQRADIEKQCYSLEMSDAQFAAYTKTLGATARTKPSEVSKRLPAGAMPPEPVATAGREQLDLAVKYSLAAQADGQRYSDSLWTEAMQAVAEGREYQPKKRG